MKVFVAGASGVIGKPLVRQLLEAGHEVTGTTRDPSKAAGIEALGATVAICDALDANGVKQAIAGAGPDVVINQLTSLPQEYDPKDPNFYDQTNLLRSQGGHNLVEAARAAGVGRFITQSISFLYVEEGTWVKTEDDPLNDDSPGSFGETFRVMIEHEREVLGTTEFEGLCLRYGFLYGPGTWYAPGGDIALEVKKRRFPVVGSGSGTFSFLHTDDAASATVCAVERGASGAYNVTDDEPAPLKDWLPVYAQSLDARPPRRVPFWLARLIAGKPVATSAIEMRGASNSRAKAELGWSPKLATWRQGFFD